MPEFKLKPAQYAEDGEIRNKKVILFNGAPNSGKDFSAQMIRNLFGFGGIKGFKDALYEETAKHFGLETREFIKMATDRLLKETKTKLIQHDVGNAFVRIIRVVASFFTDRFNLSPREALIYVSEKVIKPKFGDKFFGLKLVEAMADSSETIFFVPDSGFLGELESLVEAGFEVYLVRLHRDGCTFANDSRQHLTDEMVAHLGIQTTDLYNNGTVDELESKLMNIGMRVVRKGGVLEKAY